MNRGRASEGIESNVDLSCFENFSKLGIRLSYVLNDFVSMCGGRAKLEGLTTYEVCESFVKPFTKKHQSSYCDTLLEEVRLDKSDFWYNEDIEDDEVSPVDHATVFISHAWMYEFLHVLSAMQYHFKDEPDTVIWFDIFSNNQHAAPDLPHAWWQTVFQSAIADFNHTVMVLSPWNNPIPYTRAWCIFEAYCNVKTGSRFEIAMSAHDRTQFIKDTIQNPEGTITNMLGAINAENSVASNPEDRDRIHDVIRKEVGFSNVNTLIFEQLRGWVIETALEELEKNKDEKRHPMLLRMLGTLYSGQGKYELSQPLLEEALEKLTETRGAHHEDTLVCMNDYAGLLTMQGKYAAAEKLYVDCLKKRRKNLGPYHADILTSIGNLALLYNKQGKYEHAEPLYIECLNKSKQTLGPNHPDTLVCINNLTGLYKNQGKYEEAEPLYKECLNKRIAVLGPDHPDTLISVNNLASLFRNQGKYEEAKNLLISCMEKLTTIVGHDHPNTLAILTNLAGLYKIQGFHRAAETLYLECLQKRIRTLGSDHPETLDSMNGLAITYKRQGRYKDAERYFVQCLEKRKANIGSSHPDTLVSINNLAVLYKKQGRYDDAKKLYLECNEKLIETVGPSHPETITCTNNLALLYKKQGNYDAAEELFRDCLQRQQDIFGNSHPRTKRTLNNLNVMTCEKRASFLDDDSPPTKDP